MRTRNGHLILDKIALDKFDRRRIRDTVINKKDRLGSILGTIDDVIHRYRRGVLVLINRADVSGDCLGPGRKHCGLVVSSAVKVRPVS